MTILGPHSEVTNNLLIVNSWRIIIIMVKLGQWSNQKYLNIDINISFASYVLNFIIEQTLISNNNWAFLSSYLILFCRYTNMM